jgi:DNA ligase-1
VETKGWQLRVLPEIAFDSIQTSARHDSGLALRFPWIKAIRWDKTLEEIDTAGVWAEAAGLD